MRVLHDGEGFQPIGVSIDYLKNIQDPADPAMGSAKRNPMATFIH